MMAIIAVVPDMDAIVFSPGIQYAHPFGHRGFSHSLIFAGAINFFVCFMFFSKPTTFSKG
jgi:inner membrane protein